MLMTPRLIRVRELFLKLRVGHLWLMESETVKRRKIIIERSEPIFTELQSLGVGRLFSIALLEFGPEITNSIVGQWENREKLC